MSRLTPQELQSRLKFDFEVFQETSSSCFTARAHRTPQEAQARMHPLVHASQAHEARAWHLTYTLPTLVGPGQHKAGTEVVLDLLAGGNYPFSTPTAVVVSRPLPWNPHVHPQMGLICQGGFWADAEGQALAVQLAIHIARLLNFDEPDQAGYDGYNAAAIDYWRRVLQRRPLTPGYPYPMLPSHLTHRGESPRPAQFMVRSTHKPTPPPRSFFVKR